jgi:hypothetical protein
MGKDIIYIINRKTQLRIKTAITNIDITEQQCYRHAVVRAFRRIIQESKQNYKLGNKDYCKLISGIKTECTHITYHDKSKQKKKSS